MTIFIHFIYLSITRFMTHVKTFSVLVKNRKCGKVTCHGWKASLCLLYGAVATARVHALHVMNVAQRQVYQADQPEEPQIRLNYHTETFNNCYSAQKLTFISPSHRGQKAKASKFHSSQNRVP